MKQQKRRRLGGQSAVEFALIAPLFFLLLFGVIECGRLVWTHHELANGTREGARLAMVRGSESSSPITDKRTIELRILEKTVGLSDANLSLTTSGLGGAPGTTVTITSTYSYKVFVGIIPGLGNFNMSQTSKVTIQH